MYPSASCRTEAVSVWQRSGRLGGSMQFISTRQSKVKKEEERRQQLQFNDPSIVCPNYCALPTHHISTPSTLQIRGNHVLRATPIFASSKPNRVVHFTVREAILLCNFRLHILSRGNFRLQILSRVILEFAPGRAGKESTCSRGRK